MIQRDQYSNKANPRPDGRTLDRHCTHYKIHTWMDCTLRELSWLLIRQLDDVFDDQEKMGTRFTYCLGYPDSQDDLQYIVKDMGEVTIGSDDTYGTDRAVDDSELTLKQCNLMIGDVITFSMRFAITNGLNSLPGASMGSRASRRGSTYDMNGGRLANRDYADPSRRRRSSGFHPYERPYGRRGGRYPDISRSQMPLGEWRRGDIPPGGGGGYRGGGRGRGRRY